MTGRSGYRGVRWDARHRRWVAWLDGERLGSFIRADDAAIAIDDELGRRGLERRIQAIAQADHSGPSEAQDVWDMLERGQ